ncbi:MAG: hypothetical protein U1F16_06315 [Turneriella sp.]
MLKRGLVLCAALAVVHGLAAAPQQVPQRHAPDPLAVYAELERSRAIDEWRHRRVEWDYTIDAYYSSIDMILNLTDKPIPSVGEESESKVYRDLMVSSLVPQYAIFEASVNPLPVAGVLVRENAYEAYQRAQVGGESFNLIRAATNGFQEPYALSLFLGNVVSYRPMLRTAQEREKNRQSGYQSSLGYVGYVVSYGSHHIKDNELFRDNWFEFEWKLKGDQLFTLLKLQWSFKVGFKIHDNSDIANVFFIGVKRDRLDYLADAWDFLANSGYEARVDFRTLDAKPSRVIIELNKKWPMKQTLAFTLAVGFLWQSESLYSGALDNYPGGENYQVLLRPNIQF